MKKNLRSKWQTWLIASVLFIISIQILFNIPAPCKWLDAVWDAGDFITFVGTVTLGFVAWRQSKMANETSQKLISLQAAEYLPLITLTGFHGITKHKVTPATDFLFTNNISIAEMRTAENDVVIVYSLQIVEDNYDSNKNALHCRTYELHLKYVSKAIISVPIIKTVIFKGNHFEKTTEINKPLDLSLFDGQELTLIIYCLSNEDFLLPESTSNSWIKANKLIIEFELESMTHQKYIEIMSIQKHLVTEPEKVFKTSNIEMLVSTEYITKEMK